MRFSSKMHDPMIADVDTEVSDEEAQQSKISYVRVSTEGTETDENGDTIELTDEEKAEKKDIAQRFLDALNASEDPASVTFADLRTEINDQLNEERRAEEAASQEDSSTVELPGIPLPRIRRKTPTLSI